MIHPQPKPEPRKSVKSRQKRQAAKVVRSVRAQCVDRDGYCRRATDHVYAGIYVGLVKKVLECNGPSEWAHLGEKKRARTRGMAPETRHTTAGSLMLCRTHHRAYDSGELAIIEMTENGANGRLRFETES